MSRFRTFLLIVVAMSMLNCEGVDETSGGVSQASDHFERGQRYLADGEIVLASAQFEMVQEGEEKAGEAAFGLALARLMMLPSHPAVTDLLTLLGGDAGRLPLDPETYFYGKGGICELLSSGASATLTEAQAKAFLPWPEEIWDAEGGPFTEVDPSLTLNDLKPGLRGLELELAAIQEQFELALERDLDSYQIPIGMMSLEQEYRFRPSDIHALIATLQLGRALIHSYCAYDWPINLRTVALALDSNDESILSGAVAALNEHLFISLAAENTVFFERSRDLLFAALSNLEQALELGAQDGDAGERGLLSWSALRTQEQQDLQILLADIKQAVVLDTPQPFTWSLPASMCTFSPLWSGQLLRNEGAAPLFEVQLWSDGFAEIELMPDSWIEHFPSAMCTPEWDNEVPNFVALSALDARDSLPLFEALSTALESDFNSSMEF